MSLGDEATNTAIEHADEGVDPKQLTVRHDFLFTRYSLSFDNLFTNIMQFHSITQGLHAGSIGANATMTTFVNDLHGQPSIMAAPLIQGGYTSLLLSV